MKHGVGALGAVLAFFGPALPAFASTPPAPQVEVRVQVEREVVRDVADGPAVTVREQVIGAGPGDVLVYTLAAVNVGETPALDARLFDPIPAGTVLLTDSVLPSGYAVEASLDGGTRWETFPAMVVERDADGVERRVAAPAESYTHLRWVLDGRLDPGQSREVSFKVRIR